MKNVRNQATPRHVLIDSMGLYGIALNDTAPHSMAMRCPGTGANVLCLGVRFF